MSSKILQGVGEQLHKRFINTEQDAEDAAADAGKYCAKSNQCSLQDMDWDFKEYGAGSFFCFNGHSS